MTIEMQHSSPDKCEISKSDQIAVVGMGYVGLPLALEFGKARTVIGFDTDAGRIDQLNKGLDRTLEATKAQFDDARHISFSSNECDLAKCKVYIVTVPTPVDAANKPDLSALQSASALIATFLKRGDFVVYESTVYPGATEHDCVPILETESGLKLNEDFFVGYSPERINPGDKQHRLTDICKITSGSTDKAAEEIDALYKAIILAGTHRAPSIQVAEAAKVIENTQRDINIALINELSLIFDRLNISTYDVLKAAETKWNFLPFKPGLVGGHCIGVDPYYLTYKAETVGYRPEMILAGRRLNDGMASHIVNRTLREMTKRRINTINARVLVLGITFKENCPDIRNSKVMNLIKEFQSLGMSVDVHDPMADAGIVLEETELELVNMPSAGADYDAIVLAVPHNTYMSMSVEAIRRIAADNHVIFDIKNVFASADPTILSL